MTDDFNNKLADALWTLLEPRIQKLIEDNTDFDIDEKISEYMSGSFRLDDYSFDITDYSHEIDGMVDAQVQYLAEEWLDNSNSDFNERVFKALGEIDMKFGNMTVTYKDSVIVKE